MKNFKFKAAGFLLLSVFIFSSLPAIPGVDWTPATLNAQFLRRHMHSSVVFNDRMWVIGGAPEVTPYYKDVWWSTNGALWTASTGNAAFGPRCAHASVVFQNQMWVIGGDSGTGLKNDVWSSGDGITWSLVTAAAGFTPRLGHTACVYNGKVWVIGGYDGADKRDVWWTSNGITWTCATPAAPFLPRTYLDCAVFDGGGGDKMWVMAGGKFDTTTYYNDSWSSSDGAAWTNATPAAAFEPRYANRTVKCSNGELWEICGVNKINGWFNDVWHTTNGVDFYSYTRNAMYTGGRHEHTALLYHNKAYIIAGWKQTTNLPCKEVWYTDEPATVTVSPTITDTSTTTPTFTVTLTPTDTEDVTDTQTPSVTETLTVTWTPTVTETLTVTDTYTDTFTGTPTLTATDTLTASPTETITMTGTDTCTGTPTLTATDTWTASPTETVTMTGTDTSTGTATPTDSPVNTATPTFTITPSFSGTPTDTATLTVTLTRTASCTRTITPTFTQTFSYTNTATATPTHTISPTMTVTLTITATFSVSETPTATLTATTYVEPLVLSIEKSVTGEDPQVGAVITYEIKITNAASQLAVNLVIWDTLPAQVLFVADISSTDAVASGNYITWNIAQLDPGRSVTIRFTAQIIASQEGMPFCNIAGCDYSDGFTLYPPIFSAAAFYPLDEPAIYPNPYNPATAIGGTLKFRNIVPGSLIMIFNLNGERIYQMTAQDVIMYWSGVNLDGSAVTQGVYYYVIKSPADKVKKGKIFLFKN